MAIVVVPPVHEALSVSNFMRHDGCLCTKSVVVCGQGVSVNMDHGLASNFIPLEPGNEMVKVAHHDDLGSTQCLPLARIYFAKQSEFSISFSFLSSSGSFIFSVSLHVSLQTSVIV